MAANIKPHQEFTNLKYRPDIDGLRAIAVLLVVSFHAYPKSIPGGFIGVDIFFVISGYLITNIIIGSISNNQFSLLDFYSRRIKRIFPALSLVFISCLIFGWFALLNDEYRELGKHVFGGAGFFSNLLLWSESGYFDTSSKAKPLLHLWSLGIEEQFYLLWPILLWLTWSRPKWFWVLLFLLIATSFSTNIATINANPVAAFYSPLSRLWELLLGGLLAVAYDYSSPATRSIKALYFNWLSILGLACIIFPAFYLSKYSSFPGWWALLPTLGAVCIIFGGPTAWINRFVLSHRWLVWFGLISFPLYLWHWPLISFANLIEGDETHSYIRTRLVILSILLAWLSYRFVEKPIRNSKVKSVHFLLPMVVCIGLAGWHISHSNGYPSRSYVNSTTLTPEVRDQLGHRTWKYIKNDRCLKSYSLAGSEDYAWWFCMKQDDRRPTVIILGNSFANQLYPGFINNPSLQMQSFLSIGACPIGFSDGDTSLDETNPCSGTRPSKQNQFITEIIRSEGSFQYVILDGLEEQPSPEYIAKIKERVDSLEMLNLKVIIFTPRARLGFDPKLCYSTPFRKEVRDCSIEQDRLREIANNFQPLVNFISKSNPKTLFFDQNSAFCTNQGCAHIVNGIPLSRDPGHMSEFGSINLQRHFSIWAEKYLPDILNK